jgi:hypothetical protein
MEAILVAVTLTVALPVNDKPTPNPPPVATRIVVTGNYGAGK